MDFVIKPICNLLSHICDYFFGLDFRGQSEDRLSLLDDFSTIGLAPVILVNLRLLHGGFVLIHIVFMEHHSLLLLRHILLALECTDLLIRIIIAIVERGTVLLQIVRV